MKNDSHRASQNPSKTGENGDGGNRTHDLFPPMRYRTIVVDPPWPYKRGLPRWTSGGVDNSDNLPYKTMSMEELSALTLPAGDHAHLYLWTTNAFIEQAYTLARVWNFKPSTMLVWCKPPRGFAGRATFSTVTEFCLFARRGNLSALQPSYRNWWEWPRTAHSTKPDAFFDLVEATSPGPKLEMFARRARFGWDYWGDEALQTVDIEKEAS